MKKFVFILSIIILFSLNKNAQQQYHNYADLWKKVQKFEESNLSKSALIEVEKIYNNAKKETKARQWFRTHKYFIGIQMAGWNGFL